MTREEVFTRITGIIEPFAKNKAAFGTVSEKTSISEELQVNSARFVDIILDMEDAFNIEIDDESADGVITVGDAVKLVVRMRD